MIIKNLEDLNEIPNRDNHSCFGCSPRNEMGLKMRFFTDDSRVYSQLRVPQHLCGWENLIHGGVISTICDEIMSWSAIYLFRKIILTRNMAVDFLRPLTVESELQVVGSIVEKKSDREALMKGEIYNEADELCARSQGTFALFTPEALRRLKLMRDDIIRDFEEILEAYG